MNDKDRNKLKIYRKNFNNFSSFLDKAKEKMGN